MFVTKDSGERRQYASGMKRDVTEGKVRFDLVFKGPMLVRWAELLTRGAYKYSPNNWMKADSEEEYDRFKESAIRHFFQYINDDMSEDHAAAVMFNINGMEYTRMRLDDANDS